MSPQSWLAKPPTSKGFASTKAFFSKKGSAFFNFVFFSFEKQKEIKRLRSPTKAPFLLPTDSSFFTPKKGNRDPLLLIFGRAVKIKSKGPLVVYAFFPNSESESESEGRSLWEAARRVLLFFSRRGTL